MNRITDVVGYTFQADYWCDECLEDALIHRGDIISLDISRQLTTEDFLNAWASAISLDRENESSFDSDVFPKIVFRDQVEDLACCICGSKE